MPFFLSSAGTIAFATLLLITTGRDSGHPGAQQPSPKPEASPAKEGMIFADERQNRATLSVRKGADITVKLKENPTTGYQWCLTLSPGLALVNDTYVRSDLSGRLMGAGGTRIWDLTASDTGTQTIHAVYRRSWEPVTGNETAFDVTVIVR